MGKNGVRMERPWEAEGYYCRHVVTRLETQLLRCAQQVAHSSDGNKEEGEVIKMNGQSLGIDKKSRALIGSALQ